MSTQSSLSPRKYYTAKEPEEPRQGPALFRVPPSRLLVPYSTEWTLQPVMTIYLMEGRLSPFSPGDCHREDE